MPSGCMAPQGSDLLARKKPHAAAHGTKNRTSAVFVQESIPDRFMRN